MGNTSSVFYVLFTFYLKIIYTEVGAEETEDWKSSYLSETSSHLVGTGNVETLHPTHTAEEVPDKVFTVWKEILHCIVSRLCWVWANGTNTYNMPPD